MEGLALRMISARPLADLSLFLGKLTPFFHFDGLPCSQNCPNGESEVIRSGCVEVVDDCGPTIYNCKLNSLASGKRETLDVIFIIFVFFFKVQISL